MLFWGCLYDFCFVNVHRLLVLPVLLPSFLLPSPHKIFVKLWMFSAFLGFSWTTFQSGFLVCDNVSSLFHLQTSITLFWNKKSSEINIHPDLSISPAYLSELIIIIIKKSWMFGQQHIFCDRAQVAEIICRIYPSSQIGVNQLLLFLSSIFFMPCHANDMK